MVRRAKGATREVRERLHDRQVIRPALQRGVRAAVVVPLSFALGQWTGNGQTGLFSAFGAFALLLMVEFVGRPPARLRAFVLLILAGVALIAVGTASSETIQAAVPVTAVIVFVILYCAVLGPRSAAATTAALLLLILPIAVPASADEIPARLAGLGIAAALAVPAALLIWPPRSAGRLHLRMAATADAIAELIDSSAPDRQHRRADLARAVRRLVQQFDTGNTLPAGVTSGDRALCRLMGHERWAALQAERISDHPSKDAIWAQQTDELQAEAARGLQMCAGVLREIALHGRADSAHADALTACCTRLHEIKSRDVDIAVQHYVEWAATVPELADDNATSQLSGQPTPAENENPWHSGLQHALDPAFRARALGTAVIPVLRDTLVMANEARQSWRSRATELVANSWKRLRTYATFDSALFRSSLRGSLALALSILVVDLTDVQHGFWVALGVLAVLRSSAVSTGSTAMRALLGTIIGVVLGAVLLWALGSNVVLLWLLLPVAVLIAGVAPAFNSFAAGQGAFTLVVIILFNIIQPTGWKVGLIRIQDVAIGCGVALGVGILFWPRGAMRLLGVNLCRALALSLDYLQSGIKRVMTADGVDTEGVDVASLTALRLLDDAFRDYLADRGAKLLKTTEVVSLLSGAVEARQAAESFAMLPLRPPPDTSGYMAVRLAGDELRLACEDVRRWFVEIVEALQGHRKTLPTAPEHPGLLPTLSGALSQVRSSGIPELVLVMIRLMWAYEDLEDFRRLEPTVSHAAQMWVAANSAPLFSIRRA